MNRQGVTGHRPGSAQGLRRQPLRQPQPLLHSVSAPSPTRALRDERASASVNFEQIPLFYPRGCTAPLRGIAAIATLERFVVYYSSELIISGRAPGRGPEGTGNAFTLSDRPMSRRAYIHVIQVV